MEQFIECKCLKLANRLVPFWELEVKRDEDNCVKYFNINSGIWEEFFLDSQVVTCFYDLLNKKVVDARKIIRVFKDSSLELKIGDQALVPSRSRNHRELALSKVSEITCGKLDYYYYIEEKKYIEEYKDLQVIEIQEISTIGELVKIEFYRKRYVFENGYAGDFDFDIYKLNKE